MKQTAFSFQGRMARDGESKKVVKPKPKSGKKARPTVIHADASSFRNLVQQLTRSTADGVSTKVQPQTQSKPVSQPGEARAPSPATPLEREVTTGARIQTVEPETVVKSRIQTLAPPPLRPTVIKTQIIQPKPSHPDLRPASVRPTNPLSLSVSRLTSFFHRGGMPGLPSPSLGTLFSPLAGLFSSRHAVASPGWLNFDTLGGGQSDEESPGAVAFREALTVMLPRGEAKDSPEVSSAPEESPGRVQEGAADGAPMQIEAL
ncbi:hypothetical protein KFL_003700010 [Klebsormidium nitens]|uniref:VQ domain-containing protein n=1 Tax=Klebsormidium nitens TaxID=105231 RepID=A0A1Y1IF25_KLENI|nr:hypothetical protein KFL_003700010 [Klebsormidium nitens]|eukprot:GAQ87681.1 hypothetical protein KFL_003700010 [Klebsormidium nitens]